MNLFRKIKEVSFKIHAQKIEKLYEKYEHRFGPIAMLVGVTLDFIAFRRIDLFFENMVLLGYLSIGAAGITIINLYEGGKISGKVLDRIRLWLPLLIQFSFGGLFSAFVVFYIKSASFVTSWPFFVVLIILLIGNEFFRKRYIRLVFHMSIYFLALFSFMMFYLPIVFKSIGMGIFILSGIVSLVIISLFIYVLHKIIPKRIQKARNGLVGSIAIIYVIVNFFYIANIIPPIPLALKEGGVFHGIIRSGDHYKVLAEYEKFYERLMPVKSIHMVSGEPVYVFSAVFAPTDLREKIQHHWQYKDKENNKWVTVDKISYSILGGRDGGYRGYSFKSQVFPGDWRVDVETSEGKVIGRVRFNIDSVKVTPEVREMIF